MRNKLILFISTVVVVIGFFCINAAAAEIVHSGECSSKITWALDSDGVLTISGEGDMNSYRSISGNSSPWREYANEINSLVIREGITSIGGFSGCNISKISISNSVSRILEFAFSYCDNLTEIYIPENVTRIDTYAFSNCVNLAKIHLHDNISEIGVHAFQGTAYYDDEANWDNDILYIGNHLNVCRKTFKGDCAVKSGVKYIDEEAFAGCEGVYSLTTKAPDISFGFHSFYGCRNLTTLNLSSLPCTIDYIFGTIPYELKVTVDSGFIPANAFTYCGEKLIEISIGNEVTGIGDEAFSGCENINEIIIPDGVINIGKNAFLDCYGLTDVIIGTNVDNIGERAFEDCALVSIKIPDSVKDIGEYAFKNCKNLTDVIIGKGLNCISAYSFCDCSSLKNIYIPDNVETIETEAFYGCLAANTIYIGKNVKTIGDNAFSRCINLTDVTIPHSVENVGSSAFSGCVGLINANIAGKNISAGMFYDCSNLEYVSIEYGLQSIATWAFRGCSKIKSLSVPNSVTSIEENAFYYCNSLEYLSLPFIPDTLAKLFEGKNYPVPKSLKKVVIGGERLYASAFEGCNNIEEIELQEGITSIGGRAFADCEFLKKVTIPKSVELFGNDVFLNCNNLTIYCYEGSKGQQYASSNGLSYELITDGGETTDPKKPSTKTTLSKINSHFIFDVSAEYSIKGKVLIIALYDSGNTLIDLINVPQAKDIASAYIVMKEIASAKKAKVFLWDRISTITPDGPCEEIPL